MLPVIHGVKQLILVHVEADDEVDEAGKQNLPGRSEHAVDNADQEYEQSLREVETVAKVGWLDKLGVICDIDRLA